MNVRIVGRRARHLTLALLSVVVGGAVGCAKDREDAAAQGRPVDWDGPDVVRVAVPAGVQTGEQYVRPGRRLARGVCVFGSSSHPSGNTGKMTRDWLLAYEGRSCRALMGRDVAP
jgi:hypothetical protein